MYRIILSFLFSFLSFLLWAVGVDNIKNDYFRTRLKDQNLERTERIKAIDSLIKYSDGDNIFSLYIDKAQLLYDEGDYIGCVEVYESLRDKIPVDSLEMRLFVDSEIGMTKFALSNFRGALESIYKALQTPKPDSLRYIDQRAYSLLSDFYMTVGHYPLAKKYIDLGLEDLASIPESSNFPKIERERLLGVWYRTLASHLLAIGETDEAYAQLKKAEQYPARVDGVMTRYLVYAEIARRKGEINMAEDYLSKALNMETDNFNKGFVLLDYMNLLLENGKADEAFKLAADHQDIVNKVLGSPIEPDYMEVIGRYYADKGNLQKEVETLQRIITAKDSLYQATVMWEMEELSAQYENDKKDHLIASLERENHKKLWLILVVSVAGVTVGIIAFYLLKRHRKTKKDVEALGTQILTQESQHKEELRESTDTLTMRNQELSAMTMYMARLKDALDKIKGVTESRRISEVEKIASISTIVKDLAGQENIWDVFRAYFESVNQSFFNNLYSAHPDLTHGEIRMCAFILMGLSNKEIAALTNRSVRTIEVVKHNIRKKFDIAEPTESYLRRLAACQPPSV